MKKYLIRFNKSRGQYGRGTLDHVWRVFEDGQEYIFKHLNIQNCSIIDERTGDEWNICCYGFMTVDKETSTAIIRNE